MPNVCGCFWQIQDANGQNAAKLTSTVFPCLESLFGTVKSTIKRSNVVPSIAVETTDTGGGRFCEC